MGIFSFFSDPTPEEVIQKLAKEIATYALEYRLQLDETDPRLVGHAAIEIVYLLLHLFNNMFKALGPVGRDDLLDEIHATAIYEYASALFKPNTASNIVDSVCKEMYADMNDRWLIYTECHSLTGAPGNRCFYPEE